MFSGRRSQPVLRPPILRELKQPKALIFDEVVLGKANEPAVKRADNESGEGSERVDR